MWIHDGIMYPTMALILKAFEFLYNRNLSSTKRGSTPSSFKDILMILFYGYCAPRACLVLVEVGRDIEVPATGVSDDSEPPVGSGN